MPGLDNLMGASATVDELVDDMFDYHKWDEEQIEDGMTVREALKHAIRIIIAVVPACPDRSAAIRKLREARMDCNSAITHGGKY
jgi:hypothetical protein